MTRVYVGNLTDKIKKDDLEGEFTKYGKLNSVWIAFNPPGFAFVEFEHRDDAEKACDVLNGSELLGSQLRVEISKGRPRRRGPPGSERGGRGGGSSFGGSRDGRGSSFRPQSSTRYNDRSSYHSRDGSSGGGGGGGRSFGGGSSGYGSRSGGRDAYNSREGGRSFGASSGYARSGSSGGYGRSGRSGGSQDGGRYRSRSPAGGSHRF